MYIVGMASQPLAMSINVGLKSRCGCLAHTYDFSKILKLSFVIGDG